MTILLLKNIRNNYFIKKTLFVFVLASLFFLNLNAYSADIANIDSGTAEQKIAKALLIKKLETLTFFSANFEQNIIDASGEVLQQSFGKLSISKPNFLYWETFEPDELYIIADSETVWFYNPWIEQASAYPLNTAIAKTPILLLTSKDMSLWHQYTVIKGEQTQGMIDKSETSFVILPKDKNNQVKSLTLYFTSLNDNETLSQFTFLDATGQVSQIKLNDLDVTHKPKSSLFNFSVPKGVTIEDFRNVQSIEKVSNQKLESNSAINLKAKG